MLRFFQCIRTDQYPFSTIHNSQRFTFRMNVFSYGILANNPFGLDQNWEPIA